MAGGQLWPQMCAAVLAVTCLLWKTCTAELLDTHTQGSGLQMTADSTLGTLKETLKGYKKAAIYQV